MIMEARYESTLTKQIIAGKLIKWGRGQFPGSLRGLGEVWNWSKGKVERFLKKLVNDHMISIEIVNGQQVITLLNFEKYNSKIEKNRDKNGPNERDTNIIDEMPINKGFDNIAAFENRTAIGTAIWTEAGQGRDNSNKE
jgi:hypothetical protein